MHRTSLVLFLFFVLPAWANDVERGDALLEAGKLGDARSLAEKAVRADPKDADARGLLGEVLFRFREFNAAKRELQEAVTLDPKVWGDSGREYLARIAFFHAEDEDVRRALPELPRDGWVRKELTYLCDPPGLSAQPSKKGHYLLYVDEALAKKGGGAWAGQMLDLIYEAYSKVFPFPVDSGLRSRVYLFGDAAGYARFNRAIGEGSDAVGLYSPNFRLLIINADSEGERANEHGFTDDAIDTLFHEAFHQFLDLHVDDAPVWFDEGLADYFGPSKLIGPKKLAVGVVHRSKATVTRFERIKDIVMDRDEYAPMPLADFLQLDTETFRADSEGELVNYAQGWSLVHYLLHGMGKKGRRLVKDYFHALKQGKTREEAHAASFGTFDLKKLQRGWLDYVKRLEP